MKSVVIVTGASGAIGSATATELVRRGCDVLLTDLREESLAKVAQDLTGGLEGNGHVAVMAADITAEGSAQRIVARTVERFGRVTGCLNAAGIAGPIVNSAELTTSALAGTFSVNVFSLVQMSVATITHLTGVGAEGRIVNLASGAARAGGAHMVAYHASKHAVLGATRSLAKEYAAHSIAVNALCPGFVESPMVESILTELAGLSGSVTDPRPTIPAGRMAKPAEIAAVAAFLLLDAPTYMTGSEVVVDGGLRA